MAQCPDTWLTGIGAPPNGNAGSGRSSLVIADNAVYVMGQMAGTNLPTVGDVQYPVSPVAQFTRLLYVTRLDANGQSLWFFYAQCTATPSTEANMLVDSEGNAYLAGAFNGQFVMQDTTLEQSNGSCFLLKLDSDGNMVWVMQTEGSSIPRMTWNNGLLFLPIAYSGTISFSWNGSTRVSDGELDFILAWVNTDGQVIQTTELKGDGQATVYSVDDLGDRVLIQGRFNQGLSYHGSMISGSAVSDYRTYQLMLDEEGGLIWSGLSNGHVSGGVSPAGAVRFSGNVLSVGGFGTPSLTFDGYTVELSEISDGYILSQNIDDGSVNRFVKAGGQGHQQLHGITKVNDSQFLLYGRVGIEFDLSGHVFSNPYPDFNEPFLALVDTALRVVCQKDIVPSDGDDWIHNVLARNGYTYSIIHHLIERELDGNNANVLGSRQNTVWKTCLPCDTLTSITETAQAAPSLQLYPNPASQSIRLQASGHSSQPKGITITDMLGNTVMNLQPGTLNNVILSGVEGIELDISPLPTGIYTVSAQLMDGQMLRQRLVVQR